MTPIRILAIETSHAVGSVAAAEGDRVLAEESFTEGMVHGRELVPRMKALVERLNWPLREIALIAVSIGPGSFTGLRVGVTMVKTLAYAVGVDVVAVPTLDVLARNAPDEAETVCTIVDAKRKEVYSCLYDADRNRIEDLRVAGPAQLAEALPAGTFVIGNGLEFYREVFDRDGLTLAEPSLWTPRASVVATLGRQLHAQGRRDDYVSLAPMYIRRPQAEDKWLEQQKKG